MEKGTAGTLLVSGDDRPFIPWRSFFGLVINSSSFSASVSFKRAHCYIHMTTYSTPLDRIDGNFLLLAIQTLAVPFTVQPVPAESKSQLSGGGQIVRKPSFASVKKIRIYECVDSGASRIKTDPAPEILNYQSNCNFIVRIPIMRLDDSKFSKANVASTEPSIILLHYLVDFFMPYAASRIT